MRSIAKGMWQIVGEDLGFIGDLDVHDFADNSVHSLTWRASRDVGDYRKSLAGCWGDTDRHTGASGSRSAFSSLGAHFVFSFSRSDAGSFTFERRKRAIRSRSTAFERAPRFLVAKCILRTSKSGFGNERFSGAYPGFDIGVIPYVRIEQGLCAHSKTFLILCVFS